MRQFISSVAEVFSNPLHVLTAITVVVCAFLATGVYVHNTLVARNKEAWVATQERTPILVLADTNLNKFDDAINYLFEVRNSFAIEPYYTSSEAALLKDALHPETFLRSLAPLEKARRAFASAPTPERARNYHRALLYSLTVYRRDIHTFTTAMAGLTEGTYAFPRGTTSATHIQKMFAHVDAQAQKAQHTLAARRLCGNILVKTACPPGATFQGYTPRPVTQTSNQRVVAFLDSLYDGDTRMYARTVVPFYSQCDNRRANGDAPVLVSYVIPPENSSLLARKTHGTSDVYFRDFTAQSSSTVVAALKRNGYKYEHQASGHHYLCPDAGIDALNLTRTMLYERGSRNALQLAHASYELDSIIAEIALENTFVTRMARYGAPLSLSSLFLSRSGASTLFLLGNATLVPETPSLFVSTTTYPLENFGLVSLMDTPSRKIPTLIEALRESRKRYESSIFK